MKINRAYKVEIKPNKGQRVLLVQSAGCARFAYNWGLNQRIELYKNEKKSTSAIQQHKDLCAIKKSEFPWMYNTTKCAPQGALRNLESGFKNFFRRIKRGEKPGFPKFKAKHKDKDSFTLSNEQKVYITNSSVKLPKISSPIRLKEKGYIPTKNVKYIAFTILRKAGYWFLSVQCEIEIVVPVNESDTIVGVDLGVKKLATVSDGRIFHNHKSYNLWERKLKRTEREKSRRVKGSLNRRKTVWRLQKIHYKISCVRKDNLHKMTSSLVRAKPKAVVIEDLSVKNMLKNHKLSKSISDASFGEARRQVEYKSLWNGTEVIVADRFFPSSKTCSGCGVIKNDLKLSDRIYKCECGLVLDRDLNAATNLKRYGEFHRSLYNHKACEDERFQLSGGALLGSRK